VNRGLPHRGATKAGGAKKFARTASAQLGRPPVMAGKILVLPARYFFINSRLI
jgi:hypothetical protein